ncbi:MAG: CHAP domain-containing protein [Firmicutes bacterium]|nr:CHAP domain-containing protein [Bacillota bacterium]
MKRRGISALLIVCLICALLMQAGMRPQEVSAASSFTIRTSMPKLNDKNAKFYYSDLNRFWKAGRLAPDFKYYAGIMDDGKTGGYVWGNCTWWAYSRASEVLGEPLNPNLRGNAGEWWSCNKRGNYYPYGSIPKAGSIVVYRTHVAFVEKIVNGQIYVSESGWQTRTYGPSSTDDFFFHYGIPWSSNGTPQGYIYVTDKVPTNITTKKVSYSVKISVTELHMRSGPGTGYESRGYIKKGTHKLKAITSDGNWGQLAENGYWISMSYATKVIPKSDNNNLKSLSVSGYSISPAFKSATTSYTLTVPSNVSSVVINASGHKKATISGKGKTSLVTGVNTKTISVKAENGAVKKYTLKITRAKESRVQVSVTELNMRTGPGTGYESRGKLKKGIYAIVQTQNGWGKLKTNGYWISMQYAKAVNTSSSEPAQTEYKVKVNVDSLNMRTGPGSNYKSKGKLKKGTYVIAQTKNGWGKLKKNGYWIKLSYTTKVAAKSTAAKEYKVKVKVSDLQMRSGPGTKYKTKGKIKKGTYVISKTKNGWGKLKKNGYWIKLSYTTKVK